MSDSLDFTRIEIELTSLIIKYGDELPSVSGDILKIVNMIREEQSKANSIKKISFRDSHIALNDRPKLTTSLSHSLAL